MRLSFVMRSRSPEADPYHGPRPSDIALRFLLGLPSDHTYSFTRVAQAIELEVASLGQEIEYNEAKSYDETTLKPTVGSQYLITT